MKKLLFVLLLTGCSSDFWCVESVPSWLNPQCNPSAKLVFKEGKAMCICPARRP